MSYLSLSLGGNVLNERRVRICKTLYLHGVERRGARPRAAGRQLRARRVACFEMCNPDMPFDVLLKLGIYMVSIVLV